MLRQFLRGCAPRLTGVHSQLRQPQRRLFHRAFTTDASAGGGTMGSILPEADKLFIMDTVQSPAGVTAEDVKKASDLLTVKLMAGNMRDKETLALLRILSVYDSWVVPDNELFEVGNNTHILPLFTHDSEAKLDQRIGKRVRMSGRSMCQTARDFMERNPEQQVRVSVNHMSNPKFLNFSLNNAGPPYMVDMLQSTAIMGELAFSLKAEAMRTEVEAEKTQFLLNSLNDLEGEGDLAQFIVLLAGKGLQCVELQGKPHVVVCSTMDVAAYIQDGELKTLKRVQLP